MPLFRDINEIVCNQHHSPFNQHYLQRIGAVLSNALQDHPRTTVIRVDLHLPEYRDVGDSIVCAPDISQGVMSRFIESLKAQITAYQQRKAREGKRTHRNNVRYVWVREQSDLGNKHYHVALFVNTDTFNTLGSYDDQGQGLASLIQKAWLSALKMRDWPEYRTLIHFPVNPMYYLNRNHPTYRDTLDAVTFRLSYLAKARSKCYSASERSFGCSQD